MELKQYTAPAIEPVSVTELKKHLRIDSALYSDNTSISQSIKPDNHPISPTYTIVGDFVDVLNYDAIVVLNSGTNASGGTVDVKLQESDDGVDITDVASGSFTTVTTANDNAIQKKAYTGTKQYLRAVATVAGASCYFDVSIIKNAPTSSEDDELSIFITAARSACELISGRSYITQTWELSIDDFSHKENYIELPYPPLQTVTHLKYYNTSGTEYTFSSADYHVNTYSQPGKIVLGFGKTWPNDTLKTTNGIIIRYVAGYGATAASVPEKTRLAIKLLAGHYYINRENEQPRKLESIPFGVLSLLQLDRVFSV